jgi:hypothetical protein
MNHLPIYSKSVTHYDLDVVRERLTPQQLLDIKDKVRAIISNVRLANHENFLLAERMVENGLLAAHIELRNDQPVEVTADMASSIDGMTIERFPHQYFSLEQADQATAHLAKPLRSLIYQEALSRSLGHTTIGNMLVRCAMVRDEAVPLGEVHFYLDGEIVYKLKGVKHD